MKQMWNSLPSASGSHKDITGKYREILEKVFKFQEPALTEGLKTFIEAGKFLTRLPYSLQLCRTTRKEKCRCILIKFFINNSLCVLAVR